MKDILKHREHPNQALELNGACFSFPISGVGGRGASAPPNDLIW